MTSLPFARVNSPVCEAMILRFLFPLIIWRKPFARSIAGEEPVVPCSSTMRTGFVAPLYWSATHLPAYRPSLMKSDPRNVL